MPGTPPRVLVALPTLGQRPQLLKRTLDSLRAQPQAPLDIVMVTPQQDPVLTGLANGYGAQLVVAAGHISAAVNKAFAQAGSDHRYGAWIGDDDLFVTGAVSRAVQALEHNPRAVMCYGDCEYIDAAGRTLFTRRPPPAAPWLMQFVPGLIKSEACLFRLDAVRKLGGLDESLVYAMDLDLILRLRRLGPALRCRGASGRFGLHPGSLTISNRTASFDEAQRVQQRWADPAVRPALPALQPLLLRLFMSAARRMDTRHAAHS